ncbi:hypothetical protein [Streptomyces alkaliterrae]|uniref:Uncharacterized protein n=1 Tax=Streptomyces alkaliterrae TaxID=2213162 RepID=A0A5P0YQW2_9ACTN|nr:hypothetical protein [Streptomyces alkaliterrae]MBB1258711.1 hypothetical protein [Streptomyces alkaliterrae]MQS02704.1 hypothetical protein [Streptomyces alkaliterrae]
MSSVKGKQRRVIRNRALVSLAALAAATLTSPAAAKGSTGGEGEDSMGTLARSCPYRVIVSEAPTYGSAYATFVNGVMIRGTVFRADPDSLENKRIRIRPYRWVSRLQVSQDGQCAQ